MLCGLIAKEHPKVTRRAGFLLVPSSYTMSIKRNWTKVKYTTEDGIVFFFVFPRSLQTITIIDPAVVADYATIVVNSKKKV